MMKKKIVLVLAILFIISSLFSAIKIEKEPSSQEGDVKIVNNKIMWKKAPIAPPIVKIALFDKEGRIKIREIVKNVRNTGEYSYNEHIFKSIPTGEYKIAILSPQGKVLNMSGKVKIVKAAEPSNSNHPQITKKGNKLKVKYPSELTFIKIGTPLKIEWISTISNPHEFKVELYDQTRNKKILDILRNTPIVMQQKNNEKHYSIQWTIPSNITPGKYILKISTLSNSDYIFTPIVITSNSREGMGISHSKGGDSSNIQPIITSNPLPNTIWDKTKPHTLKWINKGKREPVLNIVLLSEDTSQKIKDIALGVQNSGYYNIPVSALTPVPAGKYKIGYELPSGKLIAVSATFTLKGSPAKEELFEDEEIKILNPSQSGGFKKGSTIKIRWSTKENVSQDFSIELYTFDKQRKISNIIRLIPKNFGINGELPKKKNFEYNWNIPTSLPSGRYVIKIIHNKRGFSAFTPVIFIGMGNIGDKGGKGGRGIEK